MPGAGGSRSRYGLAGIKDATNLVAVPAVLLVLESVRAGILRVRNSCTSPVPFAVQNSLLQSTVSSTYSEYYEAPHMLYHRLYVLVGCRLSSSS